MLQPGIPLRRHKEDPQDLLGGNTPAKDGGALRTPPPLPEQVQTLSERCSHCQDFGSDHPVLSPDSICIKDTGQITETVPCTEPGYKATPYSPCWQMKLFLHLCLWNHSMPANLDALCMVAQHAEEEVSVFISPIPLLPEVHLVKVSEPSPGGQAETSSFGAEADIVYTLDYGKLRKRRFLCVSKDTSDAC